MWDVEIPCLDLPIDVGYGVYGDGIISVEDILDAYHSPG